MMGLHVFEYTVGTIFLATLAIKGGLHVYDKIVLWRTRRSMTHGTM